MKAAKVQRVEVERTDAGFDELEPYALKIDALRGRAVSIAIETGRILADAQDDISQRGRKNGKAYFVRWCEDRCGFSIRHAYNCLSVAKVFGRFATVANLFSDGAMYVLSAPNTPVPALKEAIDIAEGGDFVSHQKAKQLVAKHSGKTDDYHGFVIGPALDNLRATLRRQYATFPPMFHESFRNEVRRFLRGVDLPLEDEESSSTGRGE